MTSKIRISFEWKLSVLIIVTISDWLFSKKSYNLGWITNFSYFFTSFNKGYEFLLKIQLKNKTISKPSKNRKELHDEIKGNRYETDLINHTIEGFDWSKLFSSKNVHEQVELFNKRLLNMFYNFIRYKIIRRIMRF